MTEVYMGDERREDKPHLEKGIPIYSWIFAVIGVGSTIAGMTTFINQSQSVQDNRISINETNITAMEKAAIVSNKNQEKFYTIIVDRVTSIDDRLRKKEDKIDEKFDRLILEMGKK